MSTEKNELRKKLREKIKDKRNGNNSSIENISNKFKKDPQSALMSMGVDDVDMLNDAKSIMKNPHSFLQKTIQKQKDADKTEKDDEGLPPELL